MRSLLPTYVRFHSLGQFNTLLKKHLYSTDCFSLLEPHQCGWTDGGCWTLASALSCWLQDVELFCVYDRHRQPQHVLAKVVGRDILIDGYGVNSTSVIIRKMVKDEFVPVPVTIEPFREAGCIETANGIMLWKETASLIVSYLNAAIGDGRRFLWHLCSVEDNLKRYSLPSSLTYYPKKGEPHGSNANESKRTEHL